jgi:hypothetical protein
VKYVDLTYCLLEDGYDDDGKGDALWRTSLAWIAYPEEKWPYVGIDNCRPGGTTFLRHPRTARKDTSRDQVNMCVIAYKINQDRVIPVPFRISEKFTMFGAWSWYKALKGMYAQRVWFKIISFATVWFNPDYSRHILAWQLFVMPGRSPLLNWILRKLHPNNLLIRLLCGGKVSNDEIDAYRPHRDFYWQRGRRGPVRMEDLPETPGETYPIDKAILYRIKELTK